MSDPVATTPHRSAVTRRILPAVAFTFAAYLSIGVPLGTLPTYAHQHLGFSPLLAGLLVSLQYIATFFKPAAGRAVDGYGWTAKHGRPRTGFFAV